MKSMKGNSRNPLVASDEFVGSNTDLHIFLEFQ